MWPPSCPMRPRRCVSRPSGRSRPAPSGGFRLEHPDRLQQPLDLASRGDMAADLALAVACLRQVEGGEALHEQLAEHHALADPRREAKADALGEEGEQRLDLPQVARLEMGEAVPPHHPVERSEGGPEGKEGGRAGYS